MFEKFRRWLQGNVKSPPPAAPLDATNERQCQHCNGRQAFHITDVSRAGELTELHLCEPCAKAELTKPCQPPRAPSFRDRNAEVEVEVERVVITEIYDQQLIIFREVNGERRFHLLTGIFEATALDRCLKGIPTPRPLTHDAWHATIEALEAKVQMACIARWSENLEKTYIAELRLTGPHSQTCVDVRPSDAVVMALISDSPIVVANELLTEADKAIQWGAQ